MYGKNFWKRAILWIIGLGVTAFIMYISDIRCVIKATTGFPCPTCGMTRAWISFMKLDFAQAFRWHPIFPIALVVVYLIIDNGNTKKWFKWLLGSTVVLLSIVFIIRLITMGVHQAPLDINDNSLLFRFINLFR